jgi:hypothetical protein
VRCHVRQASPGCPHVTRGTLSREGDVRRRRAAGGDIAIAGPKRIAAASLASRIAAAEADARISIEEERRDAVDQFIDAQLLAAEALKRRVTTDELVKPEVTSKVPDPTEAELREAWQEDRRSYAASFDQPRSQVEQDLRRIRTRRAREAFRQTLRQNRAPELRRRSMR